MTAFQIIIKAASLRTLWLSVASVVAGTAAAAAHGNMDPAAAFVCLLFAVFAQCLSNVMHRYYDDKHGYGENRDDSMEYCEDIDTPVSQVLKEGIRVFAIFTATAGFAILSMAGWWTLIIATGIALFAVLNNIGPYPLSRSVFYPVATFFIFGPLAVIGTELVQSWPTTEHNISWWDLEPGIIMGIIIGLMAVNCHVIYGVFHRRHNTLDSRTTFFGRYGMTATTALIVTTTLLCGAAEIVAPWHMGIYDRNLVYLPVIVLSMILGFLTVHYVRTPGKCTLAWRLSLVNIMLVAVLSLVAFIILGYPQGYFE